MAAAGSSPTPLRVLVADDAEDVATGLGILLRHAGYDVRSAGTGAETIALAAAFQPQAVILDISLPDLDGYETARRIRALPGGESAGSRKRAAGADHHKIKAPGSQRSHHSEA